MDVLQFISLYMENKLILPSIVARSLLHDFVPYESSELSKYFFYRPNLLESHRSLLLVLLLRSDLPTALSHVIVNSHDHTLAVKATILMAEMLFQVYSMLPREMCPNNHCLPSLLVQVSSMDRIK